ncbi:MAG: DUF1269 domain-containing protein [Acidobacteria bacterium]|nr:DUF1269 domain-containing protein [Acidobacteriota bacterium]
MSNLIVIGFEKNRSIASEVLYKLRRLDEDWTIDLDDAVAVYRGDDGELRVDQSYQLSGREGAAWGSLWGALLGLTIAIPLTAGATAPVAASLAAGTVGGAAIGAATGAIDAKWWKEDFGIPDEFIREIGHMIQPGDSAIFMLATGNTERATKQFEGVGGKVLMTSLSEEQKEKIEKVLNNR